MKHLLLSLLLVSGIAIAGTAAEIKINDSQGRLITLDKAPERIVITGRAGFMISNLAFLFENASERLLTYSRNFQFRNADGFYRLVDPKFSLRPAVNDHNTGIEEIAAMKPDLVLAREVERNRLEKGLTQLGIPVVFFNLEKPEIFYKEILSLGKVFSQSERATEIIEFFSRWQKLIAEQVAFAQAEKEKPTVLHLFYSEREGPVSFSVSPSHWMQARMVEAAGGAPVWLDAGADKGWKKIGFEQIAAWNPDYIFVTSYFSDIEEAVKKLKSNSMWQKLAAVKNKRLFAFPEDYICWDQPDTRWILGQCWLAGIMNPDSKVLQDAMSKLVAEFFSLYNLSPQQIEQIPVRGDYK